MTGEVRLRNTRTGVVVRVDPDTAAQLQGYEPVEVKKPAAKKPPASPEK